MSATASVVAAYKEPVTAAELSRTIRMLLADQLDVVGLSRDPVKADVFGDEDAEVFETALENEGEYAVIVVPSTTWSAWRKKIQGR